MHATEIKAAVREHGGQVTDVGYVTCGDDHELYVEAYFEREPPTIEVIEDADNVVVTEDWDPENNGVLYEAEVGVNR